MTSPTTSQRHLTAEGFAEYLAAAVPVVLPIPGEPPVSIFIDPHHQRIGLRTPTTLESSPAGSALQNVHVGVVHVDNARQFEISATSPELFADVYPMLCAIADRIQLEANTPLDAFESTLSVWSRLLARRKRLSDDQEIGLVGELVILRAVIDVAGQAAVKSWRGPQAEEHDFGFADYDVEVKTTLGESRQHWINSLTQLVPTQHRALWLVSVQMTRAGVGHGESLPELIATIGSGFTDAEAHKTFENVLTSLRWSDDQRDLYPQRWTLRSAPRAYRVTPSFPAITTASLATLGWAANEIPQVRYEVDVTHRDPDRPGEPLASVLVNLT